jgi:hypothetical protein
LGDGEGGGSGDGEERKDMLKYKKEKCCYGIVVF